MNQSNAFILKNHLYFCYSVSWLSVIFVSNNSKHLKSMIVFQNVLQLSGFQLPCFWVDMNLIFIHSQNTGRAESTTLEESANKPTAAGKKTRVNRNVFSAYEINKYSLTTDKDTANLKNQI